MGMVTKEELAKKSVAGLGPLLHFLDKKPFLIGDKVIWPDFLLYEHLQVVDYLTDGNLFKENLILRDYQQRIFELKGVKEFLESDEARDLKFNGPHAKINN